MTVWSWLRDLCYLILIVSLISFASLRSVTGQFSGMNLISVTCLIYYKSNLWYKSDLSYNKSDLLQIWSHLSQTVLWVWSLVWVKSLIQSWSQLWVWSQLRVASLLRMKSLMQISCQLRVRSLLWICFMLQIWSFIWAWTVTGQISGIIWSQLRVWYSNTILIPEVKALLWIPCWKNSICFEASLSWSLFGHELV